ncbi:hypothetical protein RRG08_005415 [Elysia crispata]|uniref:Uncharacterized protein n=1 Tax=Elysia crispata TaxID=231223 RepID=A0AAE0Y1A4_9GAST|nr:hypothetical protein RRG08_005415 [Elysia crispata]
MPNTTFRVLTGDHALRKSVFSQSYFGHRLVRKAQGRVIFCRLRGLGSSICRCLVAYIKQGVPGLSRFSESEPVEQVVSSAASNELANATVLTQSSPRSPASTAAQPG